MIGHMKLSENRSNFGGENMIRRSCRLGLMGLFLIGALFLCLGGSGSVRAMEDPDTVLIEWDDNGKTVELREGQVVQLSLAASPGTGYGWFFTQSPQESVLKYITHYTQISGNTVGAPTTENWFFYCLTPGKTSLGLKYARSWEPKAIKTFTITLVSSKVSSKSGPAGESNR